jgi:tetratricopeptide (TPR) repeat protein
VDRQTEALPLINQAILINPYSAEGWDERSNLRTETHIADLKKAIELDVTGRLLQPRRMYAAILADGGDFKAAVDILSEGIKIKPKFSWHCLRGQMLIESPETRAVGFHDLRVALRLNAIDADTQYWMAKALLDYCPDDPAAVAEAKLRIENTAFLRPTTSKTVFEIEIPEEPKFTFFPGEPQGLKEYLQQWGVYQYVGVTRKAVTLLSQCDDSNIKFEFLKLYWRHLYTWRRKCDPEIVKLCEKALDSLWRLQPSNSLPSFYRCVIDSLEANKSTLNFEIVAGAIRIRVHDVITSSYFDLSASDSNEWILPSAFDGDEDAVEVLVCYLYRRRCKRPLRHSSALKATKLIKDESELEQFCRAISIPPVVGASDGEDPQLTFDFRPIRRTFSELHGEETPRSDVILQAGSSNQQFSCHKVILASCKYFAAMFSTGTLQLCQATYPPFVLACVV